MKQTVTDSASNENNFFCSVVMKMVKKAIQ